MFYRFGDFTLNTACRELSRNKRPLDIEPQVFELLAYLIENRGRVVPRGELQKLLWGQRAITDNALNVRIKTARRLLGDSGRAQSTIKTVHGAGYRFVADVDVSSIQPRRFRAELQEASSREPGSLGPRDIARPSVVVLPFETLGDAKKAPTLAQGLTHDITTRLARSRMMFVIARGTAFRYSGRQHEVHTIGADLGVRYVVHGAIQVAGRSMKVTVSLASTNTWQELWSEQFRRALDDFMSVQQEIAELIVGELESEVQREEIGRSLLMPSANLDAWSAYHRGLYYMYRFRRTDCELAERHFLQSIDIEPNVPRPYAGLSFVHFERAFLDFGGDRSRNLRRAFDYAVESLSVDPLDPMGHFALSRAHLLRGELEASKESLEAAIRLNPCYAIAQYSLGWVAMQLGENELCLERIDSARRLSPYDPLKFAMLGVSGLNLAMMDRHEEAIALAARSTLQPNAHYLVLMFAALTHALTGHRQHARTYFSRVRAHSPGFDAEKFFSVFRFSRPEDVKRIKKAFNDMRA